MARPKQVIINDLMKELNRFGDYITQIRDAIQSKGVASNGKLFDFAAEIIRIESTSKYADVIDAVKRANSKGYLDSDIVKILNELKDKNKPSEPDTPSSEVTEYTETEIRDFQFFSRRDLVGELIGPNVVEVGENAFQSCGYTVVRLPKATGLSKYSFFKSNIKTLEIPSFVWKNDNTILHSNERGDYTLTKLVVADGSIPPSDIPDSLKVYNHDKTKVWDNSSKNWVNA